ncbi:MAG: hypothetical protein M3P12_00615 [Gemmatimonadota bacterium]|nr:hypothetical protein [Gemmatimonadota bacterium]
MSSLDLEISYRVARYLTGGESLADLRRWLLPIVWNLAEPENDEVSQLANRIELRLAEFLNGHWTEDDLRGMFQQLIPLTAGIDADMDPTISGTPPSETSEPVRVPASFVAA